jgi:tetratricopeptide (TPR) repeat protein
VSAPFFFCFRALLTRWGVRQAINLDGSSPEAYYLRGEALYKTQNMDQAKKHFQEALRLNPDHAKAGTSFKRLRNIERAIEGGKAAADVRPLTPLLYWGGGQTAS